MAFWVIITAIAVSYGWGMRGTLLGHGRGAMLPGALLGLCIAFMSGIPALENNWIVLAGAGAAAMYYGGGMTYGETIGLVLHNKPSAPHFNGVIGLVIKGIMWFGVAGGYLAIAIRALGGQVYSLAELVILAAMPILLWPLGVRIFNRPHKPEEGKLPKLYFSRERAESWGGHLLTLLAIIIYSAVKGDSFTLIMALFGVLGGGLGWFVGIYFYYLSHSPFKNGKWLFGRLSAGHYIDGWKIMECVLGFFGGGFIALGFAVAKSDLGFILLAAPGRLEGLLATLLPVLWLLAVAAVVVKARLQKKIGKVLTYLMQTVFATAALALIYAGSELTAVLTIGTVLIGILIDKMCFEKFNKEYPLPGSWLVTAISFVLMAAVTVAAFVNNAIPLWCFLAIVLGMYELFSIVHHFHPGKWKNIPENGFCKTFRAAITVNGYFVLTIVIFLICFYSVI